MSNDSYDLFCDFLKDLNLYENGTNNTLNDIIKEINLIFKFFKFDFFKRIDLQLIYKMNSKNSQFFIHNTNITRPLRLNFEKCN